MEINIDSDGRIRVDMSRGELKRFGLDYRQLDYKGKKTREMLEHILEGCSLALQAELLPGRRIIEVFPAPDGGCRMYFGLEEQPEHQKSGCRRPRIFCFEDSEALLCALTWLSKQNEQTPCDLFELSGKYRLIIYGEVLSLCAKKVLEEYSTSGGHSDVAAAYISEHGRCLASSVPINKLFE